MPEFTKDELALLRHGLDLVLRTEGNAMNQAGLAGLKEGRVSLLASRLMLVASLDDKLAAAIEAAGSGA